MKIREISSDIITRTVADLCSKANRLLPEDLCKLINSAAENESNRLGKKIMADLNENLDAAAELDIPICQDTGMAVIFAEIGQDVHIVGEGFEKAVNDGVSIGYDKGLLRKSIVSDPLRRVNTGNNTPAVIHTSIVDGDKIKLIVAPKGFGSENMSAVKMFTPSATQKDIIDFVIDTVVKAGSNPCPPIVLGIGIGGDFEKCAILSKKALCRNVSEPHPDEYYNKMEQEILEKINKLGIGPQGFGGDTTCLAVNIETYPTHIAGLPVAVNVGCHVTRHMTAVI